MRLPLRLQKGEESFTLTDAAETLICCVYFDDGCSIRRQVRNRLTEEEAEATAKSIARHLTNAKSPPPPEGSGGS